tara:strand:+ start:2193 stop:3617 length:1425 start_codon:yes stop_codon:yes gene_type:complete
MDKQTTASKVAEHKIVKARTSIIQKGHLGMASMITPLILKEVSKDVCSTMATDGTHIFWCESFCNESSHEELEFVLMHEALHCTWAHHLRRNDRNPELWNIATDYAINAELNRSGAISYWKMPKDALYDSKYDGKTADEIYAILLEEKDQKDQENDQADNSSDDGDQSDGSSDGDSDGDSNDQDQSNGGDKKDGDDLANANEGKPSNTSQAGGVWDAVNQDGKPLTKQENIDAQRELANKVRLADSMSRSCGDGYDNSFNRRVNEIDVETANYLEKIQDWLVSVFPDQTSWNRPHRNHIWKDKTYKKGNYLPSRVSSVMGGTLAIGVDVSGSTSYYMDGFMSQIQGLVEQCNIEKVKVCWCSTIVHHDEEGNYWDEVDISAGESLLDITPRGGGGTELTPIFELVNNYTDDVADLQGLIVFTDGEFYPVKTKHEPDIPVLWATIEMTWGVDQTEFGEAIHLPPHCLRSDLDLAS